MVYNFDFDYAALILNVTLLLLACLRKSYPSLKLTVYRMMLFSHLISTVLDIVSGYYTVMHPDWLPLTVNYAINMGYYLCHNWSLFLYVMYGLAYEKPAANARRFRLIWGGIALFEMLLIVTSPWTKLVYYYDEQLNYCNGPMLFVLYGIALAIVSYVLYLKIVNHEHRSRFQIIANAVYVVALFGTFVFHTLLPDVLTELFIIDVGFFVMYIAQDNPESHLHKGLRVFNRQAFNERLLDMCVKDAKFSVLLFTPRNAALYKASQNHQQLFALEKYLAKTCESALGTRRNLYVVSDLCLATFCRGDEEKRVAAINTALSERVRIDERDYYFQMTYAEMKYPETAHDYGEAMQIIDDLVNNRIGTHEGSQVLQADRSGIRSEQERETVRLIKRAMRKNEIVVNYQPIVTLQSRRSLSSEACVEIRTKSGQTYSYEQLAPVATRNGLIGDLDEMVLLRVCDFIERSNVLGLGINSVGVNLSSLRLLDKYMPERTAELMEKHKIPADKICFELTDVGQTGRSPVVEENIRRIRQMGFHLVFDHFGSNYVNLSDLITLPFEAVKLDKSTLDVAMREEKGRIMLADTLQMINNIGIRSACEGVTERAQETLLAGTCCTFVQGSYYADPLPEEQYIGFLKGQLGEILVDINNGG